MNMLRLEGMGIAHIPLQKESAFLHNSRAGNLNLLLFIDSADVRHNLPPRQRACRLP